jgi:hypothetical protein
MNKHVNDTQWAKTPTRERLAAARKRTLRRGSARAARSVWSKCRSRVIESRKLTKRPGLPVQTRGDNTAVPTVSRHPSGTQAMGTEAGPGSESGAKAYGGILESWESRTDPSNHRKGTTPGSQRPGAWAMLSAAPVSETRKATKDSGSEGNRSERGNGGGSLSGLIVAIESRRTEAGGSL